MRAGLLPWIFIGALFSSGLARAASDSLPGSGPEFAGACLTNLAQLQREISSDSREARCLRLEGDVWWASATRRELVLSDGTRAEALQIELPDAAYRAGQRIRLTGVAQVSRGGAGLKIGACGAVVDNNGVHGMIERSGSVYLDAGYHPLQLDWFNGVEKSGLQVEYDGPRIARCRIPESVLFRSAPAGPGTAAPDRGLDYQCYEAQGEDLPDFGAATLIRSGTTAWFDTGVAAHPEHVGIRFTGWLRVEQAGVYTFYLVSDDGSRLRIGSESMRAEVLGPAGWPRPQLMLPGQLLRGGEEGQWVSIEGVVTHFRREPGGAELELGAGAGSVRVEVGEPLDAAAGALIRQRVRVTGFCPGTFTPEGQKVPGLVLTPGARWIERMDDAGTSWDLSRHEALVESNASSMTLLTVAADVHRMKREMAGRGYPAKIRGVVTCVLPEHQAFVIQDATRGLYVEDNSVTNTRSAPPRIGEYLEVEGVTDPKDFAPMLQARRVTGLGMGQMPEPTRPTWDQLANGSLDAQYVEIQGIVTGVQTNGVTLRTRGGVVSITVRLAAEPGLDRYQNALIRLRGCLLANWDYVTHEVRVGELKLYGADVFVDQPAPADLFSAPAKTPAELMLFDPQAGAFERLKVSGQIVYARPPEYFLMQGGAGLRFVLKETDHLEAGDLVEVVGFPEMLDIGSPVLRDAVARRTGHEALAPAEALKPDDLMRARYDSTRVRLEGILVATRRTRAGLVLEMQAGVRTFVARLAGEDAGLESLAAGSRLEVSGVYAGLGGNRAAGQDLTSFELLLNSPSDVKVLARPPWWTLERLLVIVGALACVLAVTVLWITQLHRQVEERTAQLEVQIRERQRVEHQRVLEQERSRIAQDLHDELGSGITEISMLVARARSAGAAVRNPSFLDEAGRKARDMVTSLDEIVWAMNPRHDSLASLVSYFCLYADRFLGLANIAWRLEGPVGSPDHVVSSRHRHQLFLAFKESLNNVVRHSGATEVRLRIKVRQDRIELSVADNGRGLPEGARTEDMDGVSNMQARLEKLGGRFELTSEAGRGTVVRFHVPTT
ncbi:MAG: PA14 domain-containing protein [Verrucomicrobiota bacterium]